MTADNTNSAVYSHALAPGGNDGVLVTYSTLTKSEAFEANDTLRMCKIPAGYKVVYYAFYLNKKIGDATSTFKIGTASSLVALDDDSIVGATAATAAVTTQGIPLTPTTYADESWVTITISAVGANASTDCMIQLVVWATPFTA